MQAAKVQNCRPRAMGIIFRINLTSLSAHCLYWSSGTNTHAQSRAALFQAGALGLVLRLKNIASFFGNRFYFMYKFTKFEYRNPKFE
ncbi:MAG: hypothetical protein ACQEUB_13200, partial [Thermodesulfobacteriota bacterium]